MAGKSTRSKEARKDKAFKKALIKRTLVRLKENHEKRETHLRKIWGKLIGLYHAEQNVLADEGWLFALVDEDNEAYEKLRLSVGLPASDLEIIGDYPSKERAAGAFPLTLATALHLGLLTADCVRFPVVRDDGNGNADVLRWDHYSLLEGDGL